MKKLCIYHKRCLDGFASAWVVGKFFGFDQVEFLAMDYDDPVPNLTGREVFVVDFSFTPEVLLPLLDKVEHVYLIDHHKKAVESWIKHQHPRLTKAMSVKHSGAILTWRCFFKDQRPPELYFHLQDHDLWTFELEGTKDIIAALFAKNFVQKEDFSGFSVYAEENADLSELRSHGSILLSSQEDMIRQILDRNSQIVQFMGYVVPVAAMPYEFASRACEIMYKRGFPFAMTYEDWGSKGIRKFSMRSQAPTGTDVDKIARFLGGGGHRHAAGFSVPLEDNLNSRMVIKLLQREQ